MKTDKKWRPSLNTSNWLINAALATIKPLARPKVLLWVTRDKNDDFRFKTNAVLATIKSPTYAKAADLRENGQQMNVYPKYLELTQKRCFGYCKSLTWFKSSDFTEKNWKWRFSLDITHWRRNAALASIKSLSRLNVLIWGKPDKKRLPLDTSNWLRNGPLASIKAPPALKVMV